MKTTYKAFKSPKMLINSIQIRQVIFSVLPRKINHNPNYRPEHIQTEINNNSEKQYQPRTFTARLIQTRYEYGHHESYGKHKRNYC